MGFSSWPLTLLRFAPPAGAESFSGRRPQRHDRTLGPGLKWRERITETAATCDDCNRCRPSAPEPFLPESKCCTHSPFFPNFAVGEILRAGGRSADVARERLYGPGSTPLGLGPTPDEEARERARGLEKFGRRTDVICPFLAQGACGVWANRPAVCASYFCESSYADDGPSLWKRAEAYFGLVENVVAVEVLVQRGFLDDEIALSWNLLPRPPLHSEAAGAGEANASETLAENRATMAARAWLEFGDDRESFFLTAAKIAEALEPAAVWALLGEDGERLWRDLDGVGRALAAKIAP